MKLIIAILQDEDAGEAISHLNEAGFQVTRLATKGGFLRAGNTTLLAGVENEKVDEAIKIIEEGADTVRNASLLLRGDAWVYPCAD